MNAWRWLSGWQVLGWCLCAEASHCRCVPPGRVAVGPAASLLDDEGGLVSIWGMASWCWEAGDVAGRRLAAVGLVAAGAANQVEVAGAFGVDDATLRRWSRSWEAGGVAGLVPGPRGPQRRSKLTGELVEKIATLRATGATYAAIADATGVSVDSVRTALEGQGAPAPQMRPPGDDLVPLAEPLSRQTERELAAAGMLAGAKPVICEGAFLPLVGALLILPGLAATGLLEAASAVLGAPRAAFYALRSLVLTLVFAALLGEARAEGLTRIGPVAMGRLVGLDRGPEVKTIRRRMGALASLGRSGELLMALARHHSCAHPKAMGVLYVDGHVRAYHGGADLQRAHLARGPHSHGRHDRHLACRLERRRRSRVVLAPRSSPQQRACQSRRDGALPCRPRGHPHHLL